MKQIINLFVEFWILILSLICGGLYFWFYQPQTNVPTEELTCWVMALTGINFIFLFVIRGLLLKKEKPVMLPRLKLVHEEKYYIFDPCPFFVSQMPVSLYLSGEYEQRIADGFIEIVIQEKNTLQVIVTKFNLEWDCNKMNNHKDKIILKPYNNQNIISILGGIGNE